jgi:Predicted membrane protein
MKWFIKVLRHYADFSGRARRQEYWMFALFNFIFSLAWMFLVALFISASHSSTPESSILMISLSWFAMMLLPGLAVAVRRLHDLGKSGWMLLIGLIPAFGPIWLFIQLVTDGQAGQNPYGPDPKRSPEAFEDKAKLSSAGIALTVAASTSLLSGIVTPGGFALAYNGISLLVDGALLAAGIMLLRSEKRQKARPALMILMITALVVFLRGFSSWANLADILRYGDWPIVVNITIYPLLYLVLAGFTAALLFAKNPKLIRNAGWLLIIFSGISLLWRAVMPYWFGNLGSPGQALAMFGFLTPVVFILLVWTFLSKEEQPAVNLSAETEPHYEADETVVYQPSAPGAPAASRPTGGSGKGLGWKIFGLFVSIGLIIGGASGELVLRGTESSEGLVIVGVLFLIGDIFALATHNKSGKRKQAYEQQLAEGAITQVELAEPATIRVVRDSSIVGAIVPYKVYLNHEFIGKISNGKSIDIVTSVSHNIITVFDNADNAFSGDFTTDLEAGGYAEVHIKAGRFVKR